MTGLILSGVLLCNNFMRYNQSIVDNLFTCIVVIHRKHELIPLPPTEKVIKKDNIPTDVVGMITYYSKREGVNTSLALRIAGCESGYKNIKNKNSSAGGIYQQLGKYRDRRAAKYGYKGYDRFNIEANIIVSLRMIKNEGTHHWNPSRYCWGK